MKNCIPHQVLLRSGGLPAIASFSEVKLQADHSSHLNANVIASMNAISYLNNPIIINSQSL
jgi:hypothetical protein